MKNTNKRTLNGVQISIIGLFSNLLLAITKITIGLIANASSVVADGINNFSDSLSNIVSIVSFIYKRKPADQNHPFGHERIEYIAGFIVALIMGYLGIDLVKTSISKILNQQAINVSSLTVIVIIFSIIVKIAMASFYNHQSKKLNSSLLKANSKDSINDVVLSSAILFSLLFERFTGIKIDAYLSLLLSLTILFTAYKLVREFISQLLGERPDDHSLSIIQDILNNESQILGYHDLLFHFYGERNKYASVHVELDQCLSLSSAHSIIDRIEKEVLAKTGIKLSSHFDPIDINNSLIREMNSIIHRYLEDNYPLASYHDFHKVNETLYSFDLILGNSDTSQLTSIRKNLLSLFANRNIHIDLEIILDNYKQL